MHGGAHVIYRPQMDDSPLSHVCKKSERENCEMPHESSERHLLLLCNKHGTIRHSSVGFWPSLKFASLLRRAGNTPMVEGGGRIIFSC